MPTIHKVDASPMRAGPPPCIHGVRSCQGNTCSPPTLKTYSPCRFTACLTAGPLRRTCAKESPGFQPWAPGPEPVAQPDHP